VTQSRVRCEYLELRIPLSNIVMVDDKEKLRDCHAKIVQVRREISNGLLVIAGGHQLEFNSFVWKCIDFWFVDSLAQSLGWIQSGS